VIYDFSESRVFQRQRHRCLFGTEYTKALEQQPVCPKGGFRPELTELGIDKWQEVVNYVEVGPEGERVDKRDYVTNWEKTVQSGLMQINFAEGAG